MLNLKKISLRNFRSYHGTHKLEFPVVDGLYFLTGNNVAEPKLGSNGSGKSTILDAICWVLYGRTLRGLRSNEVVSWGKSGTQVTLECDIGDGSFTIKRGQKPIFLSLNDKPVDQEELQKTIRLNYESFLHSVVNPQFGKPFFSLSPSEKLTLFSDIEELDFWLTKSEEADTEASAIAVQIDELTTSIQRKNELTRVILQDIEQLQLAMDSFNEQQAEKLEGLKSRLKRLSDENSILSDEAATTKTRYDAYRAEVNEHNKMINTLTPEKNELSSKVIALTRKRDSIKQTLTMLNRQQQELFGIDAECPTCFQTVSGDHLKHERDSLGRDLNFNREELKDVERELKQRTVRLEKAQEVVNEHTDKTDGLWENINTLEIDLAHYNTTIEQNTLRMGDFKRQMKEVQNERDPSKTMLGQKTVQLGNLQRAIREAKIAKEEAEAEHASTVFWVKGFKRVRLFIIEQAFRTLELEVNNCLSQLGMDNWEITFDIERENKSGGITKGFVVLIQGPGNAEPVRWENWSGGETQRLQLAGDIGLSNLIMQKAGLDNKQEFFDEPSTHLSGEGMIDLANLLYDRAINEGKRIWIVDHGAISNFGEFEAVIKTFKDSEGSRIEHGSG